MSANTTLKELLPDAADPSLDNLRGILERLQEAPPQVLLFDGGTEEKRRAIAFYWALCNMCPNKTHGVPCLTCNTCLQIVNEAHRDLLAFDGYISAKMDEKNPGFFRAFNAENARNLKTVLRDPPTSSYRIVFFTGIARSLPEAPNALLKVLEEPSPYTLFVLLVPQRSQILPTLVSRSMCLTLPWPALANTETKAVAELTESLGLFLQDKSDFLGKISGKDALNLPLAQDFLIACQKTVVRVLSQEIETCLDQQLRVLDQDRLLNFVGFIREAQNMLLCTPSPVTPLRVLEALAMRLYTLMRQRRS
ncbi:MAG: DNA polymerase III subunit delta' [Desulfovibrionaceae bacterium]|nr:DNA polymerase III subunit delta' [Desulfovibrionaceae bacterium]